MHIGTVAVMALVVFSSIYAALRVDILRDGYVMTNSVLGIVMLAFDFIMMLCVVFGSYRDARLTRAFELMIVTAYLSNLCSVFIFETYGMAEYAELIHGLNAEHCRHRSRRSFQRHPRSRGGHYAPRGGRLSRRLSAGAGRH